MDTFESLYYRNEFRAAKGRENEYEPRSVTVLLLKLNTLGAKPNALLSESIPDDKRTIFSTIVLRGLRYNTESLFYACKKLSRKELKEALTELRSLDTFLPLFLKHRDLLLQTKKACEPKSFERGRLSRLIAAGIYEKRKNASLCELLCKRLKKKNRSI